MNILNIEFNTDLNGFTVLTDATTDRVNIQFNKCSNVLSANHNMSYATTKECNDHIDFTDEQFHEFWIAINLNDTARKLIADYELKLNC